MSLSHLDRTEEELSFLSRSLSQSLTQLRGTLSYIQDAWTPYAHLLEEPTSLTKKQLVHLEQLGLVSGISEGSLLATLGDAVNQVSVLTARLSAAYLSLKQSSTPPKPSSATPTGR